MSTFDGDLQPQTKRRRIGQSAAHTKAPGSSAIFTPFRTLGLVSPTSVPFTYIPLGKTTFQITTSVGRCLHTYDLRRGLQLLFITRPQTPSDITATFAWKERVLAAWGHGDQHGSSGVWVFQRGKRIGELEVPKGSPEPITKLLVFGSWIIGCGSTTLEIWRSATYEHYTSIRAEGVETSSARFSGHVCNMPTLLNKICVGKQDGSVEIWNVSTGKLLYTILPPHLATGSVTALAPTPALGLLAIAREDGSITLHDIRSDKELIVLNRKRGEQDYITSISFRTDEMGAGSDGRKAGVMATATANTGDVTLWDLNNGGRVMGVLWNAHDPPLEQGHVSGGVTRVEFLPGQAVMVTTGHDNSLRTWIFDETPFSPVPRPLHSRGGHSGPITRLDFLPFEAEDADSAGKWLLSAGRDHGLWGWSLRRDGQSTELSQGNIRKKHKKLGAQALNGNLLDNKIGLEDLKAPEITCMASCLNRDGGMNTTTGGGAIWTTQVQAPTKKHDPDMPVTGWESIVTGHRGDKYARTWFWGRKKAGRWALETSDGAEVKSVAMSPCGTFALVGSAGGAIDMFNLQSGIRRQRFPAPLTPAQAKRRKEQQRDQKPNGVIAGGSSSYGPGEGKHTKAVTGIVVDNLNRTVISVGLDGKLKLWSFTTGTLQHELDWAPMTSITGIRHHRSSDLVAASCDDLSIRVVDIETRRLVRELWGCVGAITDFAFSNDGRWIVAASVDCVVRVWDLPTGHLIDAMRTDGACTALAFSRTGEFLATAHANSIGISLWSNRSLFTHVSTRQIKEEEISSATLPTASGEGGKGLLEAAFEEAGEEDGYDGEVDLPPTQASIDELSTGMTTLSLVPRNRWQTLLHLDTIAARNKPIAPPKTPTQAPFFLGSVDKLNAQGQAALKGGEDASGDAATQSRLTSTQHLATSPDTFDELLRGDDHTLLVAHVKTLAPAAADLEIRNLRAVARDGEDVSELVLFVNALTARLKERRDYEVVQAWMAVFLRLHADVVGVDEDLQQALEQWRAVQTEEAKRLGGLVGYCGGVISFLRSVR